MVLGSVNMDLVVNVKDMPQVGETVMGHSFKEVPGGKGANQAIAMSRLGGQVSMIGKVGGDDLGKRLRENLKFEGVDLRHLKDEVTKPSGIALITVNEAGNNSIVVAPGANYCVATTDIDEATSAIGTADYFVTQLENPEETVSYGLAKAKEFGVYTILNPAPACELSTNTLEHVDLLTPNETELSFLTHIEMNSQEDIQRGAKILRTKGVKEVIVTLGEQGIYYQGPEEEYFLPAIEVQVVDTTAAGDSFTGALAVALDQGKSMLEAIRLGLKVAAYTVTKEGATTSLPRLIDLRE